MEDLLGDNKQGVIGAIVLFMVTVASTGRFRYKTTHARNLWKRGCAVSEEVTPNGDVFVHSKCPPGEHEAELRAHAAQDEYRGEQMARRRGGFDRF